MRVKKVHYLRVWFDICSALTQFFDRKYIYPSKRTREVSLQELL